MTFSHLPESRRSLTSTIQLRVHSEEQVELFAEVQVKSCSCAGVHLASEPACAKPVNQFTKRKDKLKREFYFASQNPTSEFYRLIRQEHTIYYLLDITS